VTRITWGDIGSRLYEAGIDRGVLYVDDQPGVPWNGLTSVTENVSGGSAKAYYVDGEKYWNTTTRSEFSATLTAFTYPDEFEACDGLGEVRPGFFAAHQRRKSFGLSYRSKIGNDLTDELGYKIHLIYGALASPSNKVHKSIGSSVDVSDFSWTLTSLPSAISGFGRTSHFIIDSRSIDPTTYSSIEDILYGSDTTTSRLPSFTELTDLIDTGFHLTVTDNGDGTFSMSAPMAELYMLDADNFQVTWGTVVDNGDGTYTATSS